MKIKVIGVVGSPHRHGNTTQLMEFALKAAEEVGAQTELVHLLDYKFSPCVGHSVCKGACLIDDDMSKRITPKVVEADGIILGTPVYFGTMAAQLKAFIDRTRVIRHNNFQLANKAFGAIAVAGRRNGGQETTLLEMILAFMRHGVVIVNNGPGTSQFGGTVWAGPQGEAKEDFFGIETVQGVGRRVAEVAKIIKAGLNALNYKPLYEFSSTQGMYKDFEKKYKLAKSAEEIEKTLDTDLIKE
jgi:multimeric flavodoxin WrbA